MADGEAVFSPLTHSVAIEPLLPRDLAHSHDFWMRQDLPVLSGCDRLVVLMLEGWNRSRGCARKSKPPSRWALTLNTWKPER